MTSTVEPLLLGRSMGSDEGSLGFCSVMLVTTVLPGAPAHRILFDTGHAGRRRALIRELHRVGLTPGDIDAVVLSHSHWDHVQNVDLFPRARVLMHPDELVYAESPGPDDLGVPPWTSSLLSAARPHPVRPDEQVVAGVRVLHLPGHTAGSIGLVVEASDGLHVLTGDAVSTAFAMGARRCAAAHHDLRLSEESIDLVGATADVVWPGHDRAFRVADGRPAGYLVEPTSLVFRVRGRPASPDDLATSPRPAT
ncbi:MBL fold metallo-hydrolase [Nocardioides sp. LHG3406-4]|uniref:MBL fold metallo-hydrolase n=1 Tax=Nocardioides sp. LHG3406-4 TaxID=2804575 RepID=UPI003CEB1D78